MTSTHPTSVPFTYQDRQWDGRFNVQTDDDLERLVTALRREWDAGKFKYILCSGVEIGTRPYQDDYQVRHVHTAAIFHNRVSKSAILKNWDIKQGNGYYLVPRNRDLPYGGWRDHHTKVFSKIDVTKPVLFEMGDLPEDVERKKPVGPSEEEKKRKVDEILIDIRGLIEEGCEEEAFRKYPRNYLIYGERLKAMVSQKKEFFNANGDPHIYLHGYPGTGKSAVLAYVYPKYYKKNLYNKFFDLYDPKVHTHIMLEDLDFEAVERLSINFLKTICDESGFPIDQKYKAPQLTRTTVLVTSNFELPNLVPDTQGVEANKKALMRRFWHVNIYNFMRLLGLKLIPKSERDQLKRDGNLDPAKIFMSWNYITDQPTGKPIRPPEEYQQIIKDAYYAQ